MLHNLRLPSRNLATKAFPQVFIGSSIMDVGRSSGSEDFFPRAGALGFPPVPACIVDTREGGARGCIIVCAQVYELFIEWCGVDIGCKCRVDGGGVEGGGRGWMISEGNGGFTIAVSSRHPLASTPTHDACLRMLRVLTRTRRAWSVEWRQFTDERGNVVDMSYSLGIIDVAFGGWWEDGKVV